MWITILLVAVNIIVILFIIYAVGPSMDSAPKFQIPNFEHEDTQIELVD